jgi:hypothetical protein
MGDVDDMFTPGGFVTALSLGCELSVELGSSVTSAVTVTEDDITCAECDRAIDVPTSKPAFALAFNKRFNDGLCRRCDPVDVPFDPS